MRVKLTNCRAQGTQSFIITHKGIFSYIKEYIYIYIYIPIVREWAYMFFYISESLPECETQVCADAVILEAAPDQ